ncbi:MAG: hypothetical protein U0441_13610 [Polyangiaceae bacterium]
MAQEKEEDDRTAGREHRAAEAAGLRADVLEAREQLDEALRIRQHQVLPVYEKLGDRITLVRGRRITARILLQRDHSGDRPEAERLLRQALLDAEAMRIPEADTLRGILRENGFEP